MPQKGNLENLVATIQEKAKDKKHFVIALSGFGGAGKSTTSKEMLKILDDATIVPLDKFIVNRLAERSEGWDGFDWGRLIEQVLQPIKSGEETIRYGVYDWFENKIVSEEEVKVKKYIFVEGVGLIRDSLKEYFDFSVWIDVPLDVASKRGVKRDKEEYGVDHNKFWAEIWQPNDRDYFEKYKPMENCDFILER